MFVSVIYIIVGVVAFLILLIVIIIVCCVVKRRNSSSNLSTNVTSDLSPAGNQQQQQQQQGKHQQENLRKQPSNNYEEITHQQRINPGIESNQTQYEHPGPLRQDRPPQYTSLSMPQPGGVYEEIPDNNKAYNRDHGHAKNRPNTPKSDGYYLKPVDERGNLPPGDPKERQREPYDQKDKDTSRINDDSPPYLELVAKPNVGYGIKK